MYESHWKLKQRPFENRVDSKFYYPAETHQAALLKLHYAIENRRSAALLCGPGGMGKSLIVEALNRQLNDTCGPLCHLVFPAMNSSQLVQYLVEQVGATPAENDARERQPQRDLANNVMLFENFLRRNLEQGRHAVIVVDEAHLLEQYELLEPLRLLLNLAANDAPGESAWTLVLVGQPTLLSHAERYHALDERLAVKCMLNRFVLEETTAYIQHRLREAGVDAEDIFEYVALERIHLLTQGIPRRINRLCDLALMVGYAEDRTQITSEVIDSVHSDLAAPSIV
jgi:general secretion pathway protein A